MKNRHEVKLSGAQLETQAALERLQPGDDENDDPEMRKDKVAYRIDREFLLKDAHFNWVVCDECHYIKSPRAVMNRVVNGLSYNAWLGISATPASNNTKDYLGYIEVIWDDDFPFDYGGRVEKQPASTFYEPGSWEAWKEGDE